MRLGGASEVAQELGVSVPRVSKLRQRPDFPDPVGEITQGHIWDLDVVRAWSTSDLRRTGPGRPTAADSKRTIGGRFVLEIPPIGSGGFADVYRATDKKTEASVAVKILRDVAAFDTESVGRFMRELGIMENLNHSNVMPIIAHGKTADNSVWYAMPLAQGSLSDQIAPGGLKPPAIADVIRQVGAGLSYIHEQGIYHRDLKPANILRLVSETGGADTWVIADFGLAVQVQNGATPLTSTHREGLGSWVYMAPEQWQRARSANHLSDIYSVGKLMQELVIGGAPVGGVTPIGLFRPVVERATADSPAARYQSIEDLLDAVERVLGTTVPHEKWESREEQSERLRDRLLSRPTRDELIAIAEWALAMDENNHDDMASLVRVLPWMSLASVKQLFQWNSTAFGILTCRFCAHIATESFSFEYCDTLATHLRRLALASADPALAAEAIRTLARLGAHHNRWRVRDVLIQTLQGVKGVDASAATVEALLSIPSDELQWSITDFTARSLPPSIRSGLSHALSEAL